MNTLPVSVVILSHNEEDNLARCIRAVSGCAEVVVLDDGSADESQRIARECGARVVEHPFVSFADQRNWAMDQVELQCDWVLHLDADEVMTPASLRSITKVLSVLQPDQVGWIARKVMLENTWLRYSNDFPVYIPRLVHHEGPRFIMRGHGETIPMPSEAVCLLEEPLLHYAFSKGWEDWWERHHRYARDEADRIRNGLPPISWKGLFSRDRDLQRAAFRSLSYRFPFRPTLRFIYSYIIRQGFRDGRQGFRFCRAMAGYERLIQLALKESG